MRFADTTRKAIVKLWLHQEMSFKEIAECYTTTPEAIENAIKTQLKWDFREKQLEKVEHG